MSSTVLISSGRIGDADARAVALDETKSIIVQAPAGSGKTELLTDRFLKLLSVVDEPEQILAITFGRAATAEMRTRVIQKLREADSRTHGESDSEGVVLTGGRLPELAASSEKPADAALRRSRHRGWKLLEQPQRLRIETIDSLCLWIAQRMPLITRQGGSMHPTDNADPLYRLAAERTLQQLGGLNEELNSALIVFLRLRDNNVQNCETLLVEMLKNRVQWGHLFLLSGDVDWKEIRRNLEKPFQDEIHRVLGKVHALLSMNRAHAAELIELANYACGNLENEHEFQILAGLRALPDAIPEFVRHWECLAQLLLVSNNKKKTWRKGWDKNNGFPTKEHPLFDPDAKDRVKALCGRLSAIPDLLETLSVVDTLPPATYTEEQWKLLLQLFTTLRYAVAQLKVVFADKNAVDFGELGLAAEMVLRAPEFPKENADQTSVEFALATGDRVRHLLVDEFQDTSRHQHHLLASLLRGWESCDGRTCFLVGDPMQSIYSFRQAEVELFGRVGRHGLTCDGSVIELETVKLRTNFRSHAGLVEPLNEVFTSIFGEPTPAAVGFTPSVAARVGSGPSVHVYPDIFAGTKVEDRRAARQRETDRVVSIVKSHMPAIRRALRTPGARFTIGVLVRAKRHAASIATALRAAGIPFRAVDLEKLDERQEVLDVLALIRALAHPMERIAWLSVLRAPWCGLEMRDLHALCGTDNLASGSSRNDSVLELLETRLELLTPDGQRRAKATRDVLLAALHPRNRLSATMSFAVWIERTWVGLGGPRCVDATGLENVQALFRMLDGMEERGVDLSPASIDSETAQLFAAPDPEAAARAGIHVMTIHKAKGLGFNVVVVPGLERPPANDRPSLLCWLQRTCAAEPAVGPADEVLVAPIGEKGQKQGKLYKWVQMQRDAREGEERKRVLYVACTRASEELHLLGAATKSGTGVKAGASKSLLATAWPALESAFVTAAVASEEDRASENIVLDRSQKLVLVKHDATGAAEDVSEVLQIAAVASEYSAIVPESGLRLRRLPIALEKEPPRENVTTTASFSISEPEEDEIEAVDKATFERPEGSIEARALGIAVHALFEKAARLMDRGTAPSELRVSLAGPANRIWMNQAASILRNNGVAKQAAAHDPRSLAALTKRVIEAVMAAVDDPVGLWILGSHPGGETETAWTGMLDGVLRTLRVDRIFRAGSEPLSDGDDCLWIVDYKTASRTFESAGNHSLEAEEFMRQERLKYQDQLQSYGRMLRLARGSSIEIRLGIYYPFMQRLEHWSM